MWRKELAKRLLVAAVVALVVVAVAAAGPLLVADQRAPEPLDTPEYDTAALAVTPTPAEGTVSVNESVSDGPGLVIVDDIHTNRFTRAELAPLVNALTDVGYTVRFHQSSSEDLGQALSTADAYVVVDPAEEFTDEELVDIRKFTNDGGRMLLVGEPTRLAIAGGLFGTSLATQESSLTSIASLYDMSLDTRYLYNLRRNDGNYKHVVTHPTAASGLDEDASMTVYTAAAVQVRRGKALLRTTDGTSKAPGNTAGRYTVAAQRGNVILLGDKTFLGAGRYNVADNEQFVAYVAEFLVSGEKSSGDDDAGASEENGATSGDAGASDGGSNATAAATTTDLVAEPAAA